MDVEHDGPEYEATLQKYSLRILHLATKQSHFCIPCFFAGNVLDLLDERPLTKSDVAAYMALLFGDNDGMTDPSVDWDSFSKMVAELLLKESYQYDPMKGRVLPWIDVKKLNRTHNPKIGCFSFW